MSLNKRLSNLKTKYSEAFSILEMTVSLAIVGIVMAMLSNILINAVIISQKSIARSFIREEIASISANVATDIRAAEKITVCEGTGADAQCVIETNEGVISWRACDPDNSGELRFCKFNEATGEILFSSSPRMLLDNISFEEGFTTGSNQSRTNILFSIVGSHGVAGVDVQNVTQQTSLSTRNYILTIRDAVSAGTAGKCAGTEEPVGSDYRVTIRTSSTGCDFDAGRSAGGANDRVDHASNPIAVDSEIDFSNISFEFPSQTLRYDDEFVLRLNDVVLATSVGQFYDRFDSLGQLKIYNWGRIQKFKWNNKQPGKCIGNVVNGRTGCQIPRTDTKGTIRISVPDDLSEELSNYIKTQSQIRLIFTITGDDDNGDCRMINQLDSTISLFACPGDIASSCPLVPIANPNQCRILVANDGTGATWGTRLRDNINQLRLPNVTVDYVNRNVGTASSNYELAFYATGGNMNNTEIAKVRSYIESPTNVVFVTDHATTHTGNFNNIMLAYGQQASGNNNENRILGVVETEDTRQEFVGISLIDSSTASSIDTFNPGGAVVTSGCQYRYGNGTCVWAESCLSNGHGVVQSFSSAVAGGRTANDPIGQDVLRTLIQGICGIPQPVCGNGFVEEGEVCDDGNTIGTDRCNATCTAENFCRNLNKVFYYFPSNWNQNNALISYRDQMLALGYSVEPANTSNLWKGTGTNTLPLNLGDYGHLVIFSGNNGSVPAAAITQIRDYHRNGGKITLISDHSTYATAANQIAGNLGIQCIGNAQGNTSNIRVTTNSSLASFLPNPTSFNTTSPCSFTTNGTNSWSSQAPECAMSNSLCHMAYVRRNNQTQAGSVAYFGNYFTSAGSLAAMNAYLQYCAEDFPQLGAVNN